MACCRLKHQSLNGLEFDECSLHLKDPFDSFDYGQTCSKFGSS